MFVSIWASSSILAYCAPEKVTYLYIKHNQSKLIIIIILYDNPVLFVYTGCVYQGDVYPHLFYFDM